MRLFRRRQHEEQRAAEPVIPPRPVTITAAGQPVTESSTLAVASAWRSVNVIADAISTMPIHTFDADDRRIDNPPIIEQPNPLEDRVDTVAAAVASLLLHGNYFAPLSGFDDLGFATSLTPVHPTGVLLRPRGGRYVFDLGTGEVLERNEILWVKGLSLPGRPLGLGVIDAQAATLGHSLALNAWSRDFFQNDATPNGVLESDEDYDATEAKEVQQGWIAAHAGKCVPAVLYGGMKYRPISLSAEASQLLESRRWSSAEVASIFGVPAHYVGAPAGDSLTYSTVESDALLFVRRGLTPWMVRLERAFSALLPDGEYVKFNPDAELRGTTRERYEAHKLAIEAGFLTVDEVRELENRPPLSNEGA